MNTPSRSQNASGFTLVELLTVIAIIAILAGLILSTAGYVQKKGAWSRAEAEIAALSAALESYKADNGIYPMGNASNTLNAATQTANPPAAASLELYVALSGDLNRNRKYDADETKSYFTFSPQMLLPSGNATVTGVADPFGNHYGYSTIQANWYQTGGNGTAPGFNPTFDLWSTGGTTRAKFNNNTAEWIQNGWIKNW